MTQFIRHLPYAEPMNLLEQVDYLPGQAVSKTLAQNDALDVTLFAVPAGEGIGARKSPGDAMVQVLQGKAIITIDGKPYEVDAGQSIVMPAGIPHALYAITSFKMLLTVIFQ